MRVVLDTNVFLSGVFWNGKSRILINKIESGEHQLILSLPILNEYARVLDYPELARKVGHPQARKAALAKIRGLGTIVVPRSHVHVVKNDPDDDKFIEAALEGRAECIFSKDKHLLQIGQYNGIIIREP